MTLTKKMTERADRSATALQTLAIYLEPTQRNLLWSCIELRDTILATNDATKEVVPVKLAWWQEELQRLGDGVPRHPATVRISELAPLNADALALINEWHVVARRTATDTPLTTTTDVELESFRLFGTTLLVALFDADERQTPQITEQARACGAALYVIDQVDHTTALDSAFISEVTARLQAIAEAPTTMALAVLAAVLTKHVNACATGGTPGSLTTTFAAWRAARQWRKRTHQ